MYNPSWRPFSTQPMQAASTKRQRSVISTPTALIKQINLLEESLGVKLFDRSTAG